MQLYIIGQIPDGPLKVGISTNVPKRFRDLQYNYPYELEIAATWDISSPKVEQVAHGSLDEFRLRGEWFSLSVERAISIIRYALAAPGRIVLPRRVEAAKSMRDADMERRLSTIRGDWKKPSPPLTKELLGRAGAFHGGRGDWVPMAYRTAVKFLGPRPTARALRDGQLRRAAKKEAQHVEA